MFSLKQSHSTAEMIWNHALEWLSTRPRIGALWICVKRASSLAVVGVESKKDIGARRMQWSMFLKNFSDVCRPISDTRMDRAKTHNALPIDSAIYTEKRRPNPTVGMVADVCGDAHAIQ